MPDATTLLKQDHRKVEGLFEQYRQDKRQSVAREICNELKIHTQIEEQVVYPVLGTEVSSGDELKRHAEDEHAQVEKLIQQIAREDYTGGRTQALMEQVMADVVEHVREEETEILPKLEAAIPPESLEQLGSQLQSAKQAELRQLQEETSRDDGLVDLTKEELYQRARRKGIQGRSSMNKGQLIEALHHTG